jgi:hypothetical protein
MQPPNVIFIIFRSFCFVKKSGFFFLLVFEKKKILFEAHFGNFVLKMTRDLNESPPPKRSGQRKRGSIERTFASEKNFSQVSKRNEKIR